MAKFVPPSYDVLKDKVVVVTGGAMGIGAALVELLHTNGAHVFFGDVATDQGEALAARLSSSSTSTSKAVFLPTDVSDYASNLALFQVAYKAFSRIDHAVAAAGIGEIGNPFSPDLDLTSIQTPPSTKVIAVNLLGPFYLSRIASVYLRQNQPPSADRSITLVSSIAGLTEAPGLFAYSASKHGVVGLMRALRRAFPASHPGLRVNAICPWMTRTRMVRGIEEAWAAAGLPENTAEDVARVIAGAMAAGGQDEKEALDGGALLVEGGRAWEVDGGIDAARPQWMGEELARAFDKGQEVLGMGEGWI